MQVNSQSILTYRDGSQQPFMTVYEAVKRPLYSFCLRLAGDADNAADAVQEAFIRLIGRAGEISGAASVKSWLYTTARNQIYNEFRREGRMQEIDESAIEADTTPYAEAERTDESEFFEKLLARLTLNHREVLVLREYEGYSYHEIAEMLDIPESTVKMRLFKARQSLAKMFPMKQTR